MKSILLHCLDLIERDNMQKHEVIGLISASLDFHVTEVDELTGEET